MKEVMQSIRKEAHGGRKAALFSVDRTHAACASGLSEGSKIWMSHLILDSKGLVGSLVPQTLIRGQGIRSEGWGTRGQGDIPLYSSSSLGHELGKPMETGKHCSQEKLTFLKMHCHHTRIGDGQLDSPSIRAARHQTKGLRVLKTARQTSTPASLAPYQQNH